MIRQYGNNAFIALVIVLSSSLQINGFSAGVCSSNTFLSSNNDHQQCFMSRHIHNYNNVRGYRSALLAAAGDGEAKKKKKGKKGKKASKGKKTKTGTTKATAKKKKAKKAAATTKKAKRKAKKKPVAEVVEISKAEVNIAPAIAISDENASNTPATTLTAETKPKKEEEYRYTGDDIVETPELDFDLSGGRPGAIIETEEQLARKEEMLAELEIKASKGLLPDYYFDYLEKEEDEEEGGYNTDDPDALDAETLGQWTIKELKSKFDYEWTPESGDPDPNELEMDLTDKVGGLRFIKEKPVDEEGIEIGWDPIYGPSNPIDLRTKVGTVDSFMTDKATKDDAMLTPQFEKGDLEIEYNEEIAEFRQSLDILDSYVDPFLPDMEIPRHVAKWHGYPEKTSFPRKSFNNNRFTEKPTDFDAMTPFRARQYAVQLARAKNAEWLPDGVSQNYHQSKRAIYDDPKYNTVVGSLRKDETTIDEATVEKIQPALDVLGSVVDFLSIEGGDPETGDVGTVYRFHYHGLMRNKHGMSCWAETLIRDCGVDVTNVIFETGFRKRDRLYAGGDVWWGPLVGPSHEEENLV